MRINNNCNLSFLKTLRATGAVLFQDKTKQVDIFQLDKKEDLEQLKMLKKDKSWKGNFYLNDLIFFGEDYLKKGLMIHTIEDKRENILGFALSSETLFRINVSLLETAFQLSRYNAQRETRYIGETMVAFLAALAKSKKKDLLVKSVADRTKTQDFYFSLCKFSRLGEEDALLKKRTVEKLIKNNEKHTGKRIELIA